MICKDCYHYKECTYSSIGRICADFKDKSKIIELLCKVGDNVFAIRNLRENKSICEYKVERFGVGKSGVFKIDVSTTIGFYASDIGKTLFLTREEAEQALKEMNK